MEHNHGPEKWFFLFWRQCWSSEKKLYHSICLHILSVLPLNMCLLRMVSVLFQISQHDILISSLFVVTSYYSSLGRFGIYCYHNYGFLASLIAPPRFLSLVLSYRGSETQEGRLLELIANLFLRCPQSLLHNPDA